jgi:2-polyprenyl-6-methoxyphenol hydroxylase-like FAD-dependent oxidoreductase
MTTNGHALIIGGSLGGLFAAHFLHAAGWRVDVFERSAEDLAGRGAGLGTHDALLRVLRRLGIDDGSALGVGTRFYVWFDAHGEVASKLERPRIMTAWARLYRPLKDALPAQHYHPAKSFVAAEQDADGITAIFADGTRATGDLLVAADGPRSTIRPQVLPQVGPDYAGYVAWRGLTAEAEVTTGRELLFESNAFSIPGGELAVSYPVPARDGDLRPGKRDYNIVWYRPTDAAALADLNTDASGRRHEQIPPPLIRPDVIAAVKADARALLAPSIADIFVRAERPIFQPIHDFASPRLVFGRIALLGDAAFVARPHVGAGVTKAALDAMCLADALAESTTIDAALADYNRVRQRAGSWAVARSREFGACVSAEVSRHDMSAAEEAQRSEKVFREYAELHAEVREWSKAAFKSEAFMSEAFISSESSRPR